MPSSLRRLLAACLFLGLTISAAAQSFPSRPIRVVVPFAAASGSDAIARQLLARVTADTKWQFTVDNKPGANGILGAVEAKKAAPDGYTLFYTGNSTHGANSAFYKSLPYDPVADFEPITRVGVFPLVLLVRPSLGPANVAEMVALARSTPGKLNFSAGSAGPRVALENFRHSANVDIVYVPYKSSPQALTDLLGGQVQAMFLDTVSAIPMIRNGNLRGLAVTSTRRIDALPNTPTMVESGYRDFEVLNWSGVFVPKGTPRPIQDALFKAFSAVVATPEWQRHVGDLGGYADVLTPAETAAWVAREIKGYKETLQRAGVEPE